MTVLSTGASSAVASISFGSVTDTGIFLSELVSSLAVGLAYLPTVMVFQFRNSFKVRRKPTGTMDTFTTVETVGFVMAEMVDLVPIRDGSNESFVGETMNLSTVLLEGETTIPMIVLTRPDSTTVNQFCIPHESLKELDSDRVLEQAHKGFHMVEYSAGSQL